MKPIRIQRKRTKGWKTPPNTVIISRPSKWGNPLRLIGDQIFIDASYRRKTLSKWVLVSDEKNDINDLICLYERLWSNGVFDNPDLTYWHNKLSSLDLTELKGKNVACFCKLTEPCHGDILLEKANTI